MVIRWKTVLAVNGDAALYKIWTTAQPAISDLIRVHLHEQIVPTGRLRYYFKCEELAECSLELLWLSLDAAVGMRSANEST